MDSTENEARGVMNLALHEYGRKSDVVTIYCPDPANPGKFVGYNMIIDDPSCQYCGSALSGKICAQCGAPDKSKH